jgi:hypothetical protein
VHCTGPSLLVPASLARKAYACALSAISVLDLVRAQDVCLAARYMLTTIGLK